MKTKVILTFSDAHSLYPGNGISDGVIDFFSRLVIAITAVCIRTIIHGIMFSRAMLPASANVYMSSLTYGRASLVREESKLEKRRKRLVQLHRSLNGKSKVDRGATVIFPCRLRWDCVHVVLDHTMRQFLILGSCKCSRRSISQSTTFYFTLPHSLWLLGDTYNIYYLRTLLYYINSGSVAEP